MNTGRRNLSKEMIQMLIALPSKSWSKPSAYYPAWAFEAIPYLRQQVNYQEEVSCPRILRWLSAKTDKNANFLDLFNPPKESEMTFKRSVIPSKRISYPDTPLEIKAVKRRRKDTSKASSIIKKQDFNASVFFLHPYSVDVIATAEEHNMTVDNPSTTSKDEEKVEPLINDYSEWIADGLLKHHAGRESSPFVAAYTEYLIDGLQIPNDGLDAGLLRKRYAALLCKYGETKAQKPYATDVKDPRRPKQYSIALDEEQLVHID
ncbi:hypothetical protein FXO38_15617 [Capsicum annuum]|nr:hypothetical protein FXO38_15617 [Capsicum annuum]